MIKSLYNLAIRFFFYTISYIWIMVKHGIFHRAVDLVKLERMINAGEYPNFPYFLRRKCTLELFAKSWDWEQW